MNRLFVLFLIEKLKKKRTKISVNYVFKFIDIGLVMALVQLNELCVPTCTNREWNRIMRYLKVEGTN